MKKFTVLFSMAALLSLFLFNCSELPTDADNQDLNFEKNLSLPDEGDPGEELGTIKLVGDDNIYDTGIEDQYVEDDVTISDLLNDCAETTKNHGQYVSCVSHTTTSLMKQGLLTGKEKGVIVSIAAQSDIGK